MKILVVPTMVKEKNIRIISFDMDGTLIPKRFPDRFWLEEIPKLYSEEKDVDIEQASEMIIKEYEKVGKTDIRWYLTDFWFDKLGLENRDREILEDIREDYDLYPDAKDAIEKLSRDYELIIISRGTKLFIETGLGEFSGYFSRQFSTVSDFQSPIKSPDIYRDVCRDLEIEPDTMIHVGDDPEQDYENPKEVGITSFLLDRDGGKKNAIEDLDELIRSSDL